MFDVNIVNIDIYTASCGAIFIEQLIEHDLLTSYLYGIARSNTTYTLDINPKVLSVLGDNIKSFKAMPLYLPMVEVPKVCVDGKLGGYLLNDVEYRKSVIIDKKNLKYRSKVVNNSLYNMINGVSSTPFCINKDLLSYLTEYGRMNNLLINDPRTGLTEDSFKLMKSRKNNEYKEFLSSYSKYELEGHILSIANIYRNYERIYFPIRLDIRGRIYCTPAYLNYQGNELAKALLLFSEKSKLYLKDENSLGYFYSYGANCYGNGVDKQSRLKKMEWVKYNHDNIMNFKDSLLLSKAKNKFLFIAFALEYIKIHNVIKYEKASFVYTQLPIQLDATCNGYQHLSMLSRDNDLGKNLNLMSAKKEDVPKDFYGLLINKITHNLMNSYQSDTEESDISKLDAYKRILEFKPDRSLIKKPVMIESYNATLIKSADALKDSCYCINEPDFSEEEVYDTKKRVDAYKKRRYIQTKDSDPNIYLLEDDFVLIVEAMKSVLKNDYPKLAKLRLYLSEVAKVCNKLSLSIP